MKNEIKEKKRAGINWLMQQEMDVKMAMFTHYIEICRLVANSYMEEEVQQYTGERYMRNAPQGSHHGRWGHNPGSIGIGSQRIRVDVPRVYDKHSNKHISLKSYKKLHGIGEADEQMVRSVLHGISMRDYGKVVNQVQDGFGLSSSRLSRKFVEQTGQALKAFESRRLDEHEILAVFIDGKQLAAEQMVIALGVTAQGKKIFLGVVQVASENSESLGLFFEELIERGLNFKNGLLFIIDGAKGIHKAIVNVFGKQGVIQRCQWHKRENIVSYLNPMQQRYYRKKLQTAYSSPDYHTAKGKLNTIKKELQNINRKAAASLEEGLEETLTIQRMDLYDELGRSFTTTNCIESVNSQLEKYIRKVKRWSSGQRYRWVVAGLIEIEPRLRKVRGYKHLHLLKEKLKQIENPNITQKVA